MSFNSSKLQSTMDSCCYAQFHQQDEEWDYRHLPLNDHELFSPYNYHYNNVHNLDSSQQQFNNYWDYSNYYSSPLYSSYLRSNQYHTITQPYLSGPSPVVPQYYNSNSSQNGEMSTVIDQSPLSFPSSPLVNGRTTKIQHSISSSRHNHQQMSRQTKKQPNWEEFYRNGYPDEIIVISSDEEQEKEVKSKKRVASYSSSRDSSTKSTPQAKSSSKRRLLSATSLSSDGYSTELSLISDTVTSALS